MPIEFHCPQCQKMLRTPDGTAGRQATCPSCQAVCTIPSVASDAASLDSPLPTHASNLSNPYASPSVGSELGGERVAGTREPRPLVHQRIGFRDVLDESWRQLTANLGSMALFGFVTLLPMIVITGMVAALPLMFPGVINEITANLISFPLSTAWSTLIFYSCARLGLNSSRGITPLLNKTASFGQHIGRFVLFTLVIVGVYLLVFAILAGGFGVIFAMGGRGAAVAVMVVVALAVAICALWYFFLPLVLTPFFIVDYDHDLGTAMRLSREYMKQNVGTTFGLYFITSIASVPIMLCTLYLGSVLVIPFIALMFANIYMFATGQYLAGGDHESV